tara:strand:- start:353 stop:829 length:477 start_codon:yes stop_codon:yes gene_type:complete
MSIYKAVDSSGATIFEIDDDGALSTQVTKFKTSAQRITNTDRLVDDDDLHFPISAGEAWVGNIVIFCTSTSALTGLQFDLDGPNFIRYAYGDTHHMDSETSGTISLPMDADTQMRSIRFSVKAGLASGTITFRWAQATAGAASTQIDIGSHLLAWKVP